MTVATPHPFAFPAYRFYWIARFSSTIAQNCVIVIIGWQVYEIARRTMDVKQAALQLGIVGLVQFVPLFALVLVAGWVADRIDRRFVSRACTTVQLACAALLAWLGWMGATTLADLFVMAALLGVARSFGLPALNALAPNLVPVPALPQAVAMNAIASRLGAIIGPATAGYLYASNPTLPYVFSVALFAVCLLCMFAIPPIAPATIDRSRNPWRQMVEGLHYVRRNRLVLGAISLDLFAVLLGGATALLPAFANDILHAGPTGLGHLRAAPAAGALATALLFAYRPLRRNVGRTMLVAVGVFGAATVGFGLARTMPLSLACLFVLGAADMLSVYVRQSLIQLSTPNDMRGRVGAVSQLFISASNELGEAESGFTAALIGPVATAVAGGFGAILVTILWARLFPALRTASSFEEARPTA